MFKKKPQKRNLTFWEKLSIFIIIFLIIAILVLIFHVQLVEYYEAIIAWYEGE